MTRFLHTSDWQLGMTRHFLSEEAQARFTHDRIEGIRRLGQLAREERAEFVVVAGDVFESNQVDRQTVVRTLDALGQVPVPVFLLPGNHDPLDAASVYRSPTFLQKKPSSLIVLQDSRPIEAPGTHGVDVVGAPWYSQRPLGDLVAELTTALQPVQAGRMRIAVGHGAVDTLSPEVENPALIRLAAAEEAVRSERIQYLALGDRHSVTDVGTTGAIWYSGAHVATDYGEVKSGHFLVVDVNRGSPPEVFPGPLYDDGAWRFIDERFDLNSPDDVDSLARFLDAQAHKERTILRLTLVGTLSLAAQARLEDVLDDYEDHFGSIRLWERHCDLAVLPDALDAERLQLSGYARAAWDELSEARQRSGDEGRIASDAIALLYRMAKPDRAEGSGRGGPAS